MSEKNEKVFRGVWIPAEIWETHTLSWMEKCLWAEISSLGTEEKPCFASNGFLAAKFNSTESSISNMISRLKSMGMIKHLSYDGRSRKMIAILPKETSPTSEVRVNPQVKSDFTRECNRDTSRVTKVELPLTPSKGNEENSAEASSSSDAELFPTEQLSTDSPRIANRSAMASRSNAIPGKTAEFQARANRLMNRRNSTPWSKKELISARPHLDTCEEDWQVLEKYYACRGQDGYFHRTSMQTLLNNFASEIDKARSKQNVKEVEDWKPRVI